jgi:hypothetical protein
MSTTYGELQTKVSRALRDEGHKTFPVAVVQDMIQAGWAEIDRIAPERFMEQITPVDDTLTYTLRTAEFDQAVDEIEVFRVEVWDTSTTPDRPFRFVEPAASHPTGLTYSQAGWFLWGGQLSLPNRVVDMIDPLTHVIKVWGYSPWPPVTSDLDVLPFGKALEEAITLYTFIEAARRLLANRTLFTQWQTRSNNTDVTPAALMNDLNMAQDDWRRKARAIFVMREAP